MKHLVTVRLGTLAVEALAGKAYESGGEPSPEDVLRAINFYLHDKGVNRAGWVYPPFLRSRSPGREVEFELRIEDSLWRLLRKEAAGQRVTVEQLLEHAALYYAAELDSGHVTERMLGDAGES
jgi:hypothetical protein